MIIARTDTDTDNDTDNTTTVPVTNINSHLQDDTVIETTKYITKAGVAELVAQAKAYIDSL